MNETIGWVIYALACAVFAGMAFARKERPALKTDPMDIYEIDDIWHDLGGGSMLENPPTPLRMAEAKALIEKAMGQVNGKKTSVIFLEHGTAQITPEMEKTINAACAGDGI